jgi:hypothetical protein
VSIPEPEQWNGSDMRPMDRADADRHCDKCGSFSYELAPVQVCKQTMSSPAEYEGWCRICAGPCRDDDDYERAAARYDGTGKDWR